MFEPIGRMDKHSCNDLEYVQGEGGFRLMLPVQALHQLKSKDYTQSTDYLHIAGTKSHPKTSYCNQSSPPISSFTKHF